MGAQVHMSFKKKLSAFLVLIIVFSILILPVSAKKVEFSPYSGYEYNSDKESVAAPITYVYNRTISYKDLGIESPITEASDFLFLNDVLYVLDSSNGRIIELNKDLSLRRVRENFTDKDGNSVSFLESQGFTVSKDGYIYVSDTKNTRILVFNDDNELVKEILKPETSLVGYDFNFDVTKLMLNSEGVLYAIVNSVNDGAFAFSAEGEFLYFFGRNTVVKTADVLLNYFRKRFMTREQLTKIQNYTPTSIANFDIDKDGFVYTISARDIKSDTASSVRKLNFKGQNVFETHGVIDEFGDLEQDYSKITSMSTSFSDIEVDNLGFIFLLDVGRGRIFEYSSDGQLVGVFGGYGEQYGMFENPIAVETIDEKVLVLNKDGTITEFVPTEYINLLGNAFLDLDTSNPQKAIEAWEKVLKLNTNSQYPYYGLGMAYEQLGDYKAAMQNFKLSSSKTEYSDAFHEYRKQYLNDNLWWILLVTIVSIGIITVAVKLVFRKIKASSNAAYSVLEQKYTFPLYTLLHPSDGFEQFKYRRDLPSYKLSAAIIALFFFVSVFKYFATGYCFNNNTVEKYSIFSTLLGTVVLYILFVVGNWAVCSLFDGNGTMKEIASVTAYSLIPYIVCQFICTVLSNVLTLKESIAISIIMVIGIIWSALLLLIGLSAVNQYYTGKTVWTVILTAIAMLVLALMAFLFFSLIQQVLYFVKSIWDEYQLR